MAEHPIGQDKGDKPGLKAELMTELDQLFTGKVNVADGVVPPLVFVIANSALGVQPAAALGLASAGVIVVWRLYRGRALRFALAGLGGTIIAVLFALRSDDGSGFFLPGIITGGLTTSLILVSIGAKRPFVAWTSWLMRGWPIDWYWHPRIRPAYTRASWLWAGFFGVRTATQGWLYATGDTTTLGLTRVITGWPALVVLLIATYVLGRRWLEKLGGPSVAQFQEGKPPPWTVQPTGY